MKISNKLELRHRSSDIDVKGFLNLYKKCTAKSTFFYTTLVSNNPLRFRNNLLKRI